MRFEFRSGVLSLNELARPELLSHVVGQEHLLKEGSPFLKILGMRANLIFYGPSGTGKTSVARIVAKNYDCLFYSFNATECTMSDVKKAIANVENMFSSSGVLIYIDEIQYFTKRQQQNLLSCLDSNRVFLIASTTESPFFSVYGALLSRCLVFEFKTVSQSQICKALERAAGLFLKQRGKELGSVENGVFEKIAACCCGDVRRAVNFLEACFFSANGDVVSCGVAEQVLSCAGVFGLVKCKSNEFYDLLSALQKSIRGSDENAAIYYLARILNESSLPAVCRRLLVISSEDIGLAFPSAISIVKACVDSAIQIGMPQAQIVLAQAVVLLAILPKSNASYEAMNAAVEVAKKTMNVEVPRHLQNVHCDGIGNVKNKNNSQYKYPHEFKNHYVNQAYLPDELKHERFFKFGSSKFERAAKALRQKLLSELDDKNEQP